MSEGAATLYFNVNDPVWYYDTESPTDPSPAPGVVTAVTGEADFTVEITLADLSAETRKHVGPQEPAVDPDPSPSVRWIELREREMGGPLLG